MSLKPLLSGLLLLLPLAQSQAEERWFDIEVIVFKRDVALEQTSEHWPQPQSLSIKPQQALLAPMFECIEPCAQPSFRQLPSQIDGRGWPISGATKRSMLSAAQLELKDEFARLNAHDAYTPLMHIGWREVVAPRNRAKHYQLVAGRDFSDRFADSGLLHGQDPLEPAADDSELPSIQQPIELQDDEQSSLDLALNDLLSDASTDEPAQVNPLWELDGGIQVYLQHYLYIDAQFLLRRPELVKVVTEAAEAEMAEPEVPEAITDEPNEVVLIGGLDDVEPAESSSSISQSEYQQQLQSFRFDQRRRVRSGEVHYFDHPLMGMLIQIRRSPEASADASFEPSAEQLVELEGEDVQSESEVQALSNEGIESSDDTAQQNQQTSPLANEVASDEATADNASPAA
ncbi:peptidoglycan binding protein CsiV [Aliagarivorans marinus]|uniref:peptidoglycan binding protein CsiV n=1 Tax=Aliagarivorans marinus TaxID=561965 RepID=UPI000410387B|nr:peptidoglycan binding protein CsiV [Aliagarivorans marinus]